MIPFAEINRAALSQLPSLLREWLPAGKMMGREFVVGDLAGSPGESLSINTTTGAWADFAAAARGGDPISLYAAIHRMEQGDAARELGKRLGVYLNGEERQAIPTKKSPDWRPMLPPPPDAPVPDLSGYDHVYTYRDARGRTLFYIRRREAASGRRKVFTPLTFGILDGKRGWHAKHPAAPRPLYGLDRLNGRPVLICEGEKACDAARAMLPGYACLSWAGGTNSVDAADWSALAGRSVTIWPDNDEPGHKAAARVAEILGDAAILRVADLPDKADAADVQVDAGWVAERAVARESDLPEPPEEDPAYYDSLTVVGRGTDEPPIPPRRARDLPPIRIVDGEIDRVADAGEAALAQSGIPVFQRGRSLVRPVRQEVPTARGGMTLAPSLAELNSAGLIYVLNQAVEWQRFDGQLKAWRAVNPTKAIAEVILSRVGNWTVPSIAGVITTPTLRPDGSLLDAPGYDPATRLFHVADPRLKLARHVYEPTRVDAERALDCLQSLLAGFPFVSDVDRAVSLSALLTGVNRGALSVAPMHAFRAYAAGTGKSYLADLVSCIASGRPCPVMSVATREEETEKRLVGLLAAGFPLILIDNVNGDLGGDLLCQAVERPLVRVRVLGKSDILEIETRATVMATGNTFRVKGDMTRRTLICTLDAGVERPELREFEFDPVESVLADRGRYVSACLTIVRAYMLADPVRLQPIASFGEWSGRVRGALVWLGCPDPVQSMEVGRDDDPELAELRAVANLWAEHIGFAEALTVNSLCHRIEARVQDDLGNPMGYSLPELRDAILAVAGERGAINTRKLGKFFSRNLGKIVDGMRLQVAGKEHGVQKWKIEKLA